MAQARVFGDIEGYSQGHLFQSRRELSLSGIHRPLQAGISGSENDGADSIVLSGGYEDDEDHGHVIIYTGHGGRDQVTSQQVGDQILRFQNLALAKNSLSGLPVRVIRGSGHRSPFSPPYGYRYDGLYRVESYWRERGKSGHIVWRYRLESLNTAVGVVQASATIYTHLHENQTEYEVTQRIPYMIQRIARDSRIAQYVKGMYECRCQVCGTQLRTMAGVYAESAHIRPLGAPHRGPDTIDNVLCLCPNHHVLFDYGAFAILDDLSLLGIPGKLTVIRDHPISPEYSRYHRAHFYESI